MYIAGQFRRNLQIARKITGVFLKGGIHFTQVPPTPCGWHFYGFAHA